MKPAPYRVLFINDTTHIETCVSPWRGAGEPFAPAMLEASVDETAGTAVDAHLLQPGVGWVPWWRSRAYPFAEHVRFMRERFGKSPEESGYAAYMAAGGDMVEVFVRRCRERGQAPFVSLRLNDSHGHEFVTAPRDEIFDWAWHVLTPVHVDHPEWRISQNLNDWGGRVLNWSLPEVPRLKLAFIEELCEGYDLDGFELDFMRHCRFFPDHVPLDERQAIMVEFVTQVRALLDRTARGGRRWLCARIPCHLAALPPLGLDPAALVAAGVDMLNCSPYYFTVQQTDAPAIKRLAPDAAVYLELAHTTYVGPLTSAESKYDNFSFRRTTARQYHTAAHLAYARGVDGVSLFNFVYYREHGVGERGPFREPPFDVLERLADRDWLARQPQHYVLGAVWNEPPLPDRPLPRRLAAGERATFSLDLAPPTGGWRRPGKLRIQAGADLGDGRWSATLDGRPLTETDDRAEPYPNPDPALLGSPAQHRAWVVPPELLRDGVNRFEVTCEAADRPAELVFVDLALP